MSTPIKFEIVLGTANMNAMYRKLFSPALACVQAERTITEWKHIITDLCGGVSVNPVEGMYKMDDGSYAEEISYIFTCVAMPHLCDVSAVRIALRKQAAFMAHHCGEECVLVTETPMTSAVFVRGEEA